MCVESPKHSHTLVLPPNRTPAFTQVYPVYAHWAWSWNGWLDPRFYNAILGIGSIDFAGSGVVHTLGGFAALMGSIVLGPRVGRWDPQMSHIITKAENPAFLMLGSFILWFGW
jgi:Amt family ammonium transporter